MYIHFATLGSVISREHLTRSSFGRSLGRTTQLNLRECPSGYKLVNHGQKSNPDIKTF